MALIKPKSGGIDTSDATATPSLLGKYLTAYVKGEKITGKMPNYNNLVLDVNNGDVGVTTIYPSPDKVITMKAYMGVNKQNNEYLALSNYVLARANSSYFGDATPEDVASGKTFTSTSGLMVSGTATIGGGTDTSDATVTAADVINGVTAYGADGKITGTMPSSNGYVFSTSKAPEMIDDYIKITTDAPIPNKMAISGNISGNAPASTFGNASASDVAEGKTFTSTAGVAVTGTAKIIETVPVTIKKTGSGVSSLIWWTEENGTNANTWNGNEETTINVVQNTAIFFSGSLVSSVSGTVDNFVKADCSIVIVYNDPVTILIP